MKYLLFFLTFVLSAPLYLKSQCFEIESILVDACSNPEDENEMVRFKVGSSPLNTANLSVVWATTANPWNGICQNATTATKVATLNSSIVSCGYLKEPVGGVLPANARVLLITSVNFNTSSASFANLSDTLYVIFHCNGTATSGNFGNHTASGTRTLTMSFTSPASCSDVVTYNTNLLVQGGNPLSYDGGTVEYTPSGTATYINNGCQAPVSLFSIDAGPNKTTCSGNVQSFTASASGYTSIIWSLANGAQGTLSPTNSLTTTYTPSLNETGTIKLYCSITKSCSSQTLTVKDSVNLTINQIPQPVISASSASLCPGQTSILSYSISNSVNTGTTSIIWLPSNATTPTISVNSVGTYSLRATNSCGNNTATFTIVSTTAPPTLTIVSTPTVLCTGQTATLTLTGSIGTYSWNNTATTNSILVSLPGVYSAVVTNGCGSANAFITLSSTPSATVSINASSTIVCAGNSPTLTATSNVNNFIWDTGATTNTIVTNTIGVKTVSVSNSCGISTATVMITSNNFPPLVITPSSNTICPGQTATLTVTGGVPLNSGDPILYVWSTSASTSSVITSNGGVTTVSNTNVCGTNTANISITVNPINASISANPLSGVKPLLVNFTNNSSGATNYNWDFGNGTTSTTQTVVPQTYTVGGNYYVYLTVTDGLCSDIDSVIINVLDEEAGLIVPNVFTPNGDNANDFFKVNGFNITEFKGLIYDRWGLKLFEWNNIKDGWDGKHAGKTVSDGTYFYIITAKDLLGKEINKQGSLLLIK